MKKNEEIELKLVSDEDGVLINEATGHSFAWEMLHLIAIDKRKLIVANIIEGIAIIILLAIILFK